VAGQRVTGDLSTIRQLSCTRGWIWSRIDLALNDGRSFRLDALTHSAGGRLWRMLESARARRLQERVVVAALLAELPATLEPLLTWVAQTERACHDELARSGWLSREFARALEVSRPDPFGELLEDSEIQSRLAEEPATTRHAIAAWSLPIPERVRVANERHVQRELVESAGFLATVEKAPLTEEQARAVLCFDSRILLVAAAGSGKTSTLIAKAGYAVTKGYAAPRQILLLAFNADAAAQLRGRLAQRLQPFGIQASGIRAVTFHAFGLDVIAEATGIKPVVAQWVIDGREVEFLLAIIEQLRRRDDAFGQRWNEFRSLFADDLPPFEREFAALDARTLGQGPRRFPTVKGDYVRSRGEQRVADWLYYNGIRYEYERPYEHPTATADRAQYKPDFYLPDIPAYLEHWALDRSGRPPASFIGYTEDMAWKKDLHRRHGTILLETTMAGVWDGKAFEDLGMALARHGLALCPEPERIPGGRSPREWRRLGALFRSAMVHAKSNRLTIGDLYARAEADPGGISCRRRLFLRLLEVIWAEWNECLKRNKVIDFEDMLNLAADGIESGEWQNPYTLVMADEYQDASRARVRLLQALVRRPGTRLFAVGDDWQGINRFAGADLSAMTGFGEAFDDAVVLRLETTFRCPQSLCDISSRFIQRNPRQIRKHVRAAGPDVEPPITIIRVSAPSRIRDAIAARIVELASEPGAHATNRRLCVDVLGRYNRDAEFKPAPVHADRPIEVTFRTVHAAKGLEADHVIVPNVVHARYGFPSQIADDPALLLAMPRGDDFPFAEERRLFYVALTRARRTVTLVTVVGRESPFIAELLREPNVRLVTEDGAPAVAEVCPGCGHGILVTRRGPYGLFKGCSQFPDCMYTLGERVDHSPSAGSPRAAIV